MPWKESSVMEERLRFVARLLDGEGMSEVCRSFGISRKTGYKIFKRYKEQGVEALCDRSRRLVRYANQLPEPIEQMIVRLKKEKPHWGAQKIRELLVRRVAGDVRIPAKSTVHAVLDRHGLVQRARQRRRHKAQGTPLSEATAPNALWCADFKGEFKLVGPPRERGSFKLKHAAVESVGGPRQSRPVFTLVLHCPKASLGPGERSFTGEACVQALPHISIPKHCQPGPGPSALQATGGIV